MECQENLGIVSTVIMVVIMRFAVIGSGISGLASAYLLQNAGEVHLFETADRLGGHSNTVDAVFGETAVPEVGERTTVTCTVSVSATAHGPVGATVYVKL